MNLPQKIDGLQRIQARMDEMNALTHVPLAMVTRLWRDAQKTQLEDNSIQTCIK
jgi:hypothetical protein